MVVAIDGPRGSGKSVALEVLRRSGVRVAPMPFVDVPQAWPLRSVATSCAWIVEWARAVSSTSAEVVETSPLAAVAFHPQHAAVLRPLAEAVLADLQVDVVLVRGDGDGSDFFDSLDLPRFDDASAVVQHLLSKETCGRRRSS